MTNETPRDVRNMLTIEQVLRIIPVSRTTLQVMENQGRFPKGYFISGNRKVWFADEIAAWQNSLPEVAVKYRRGNAAGNRGRPRPRLGQSDGLKPGGGLPPGGWSDPSLL